MDRCPLGVAFLTPRNCETVTGLAPWKFKRRAKELGCTIAHDGKDFIVGAEDFCERYRAAFGLERSPEEDNDTATGVDAILARHGLERVA